MYKHNTFQTLKYLSAFITEKYMYKIEVKTYLFNWWFLSLLRFILYTWLPLS